MGRVLLACECSGSLRDAFARHGHYAMSVDLKGCPSPGRHHQGSVFDIIDQDWDLMVAFPPCTYLARPQVWRYRYEPDRVVLRDQAIEFVERLSAAHIPRIAIENPPGYLSSGWKPWSQLIQPYNFGDPYRKEVCLWLKNVPPVMSTLVSLVRKPLRNHVNGRMSQAQKSHIKSSWSYFPGMCEAIADQWGRELPPLACPECALLDTNRQA